MEKWKEGHEKIDWKTEYIRNTLFFLSVFIPMVGVLFFFGLVYSVIMLFLKGTITP